MRPGEIFLAIRGSGEMADTQVLGTCVFGRVGSSPTSRTSKLVLLSLFLGLLPVISLVVATPANAATVTASGPHASPSVCNQTVGNATNVVAYRLAGGDCVVEFKNAGATTTWTSDSHVSRIWVLVVAGGGGGGAWVGGGGGGGGVIYRDSSNMLAVSQLTSYTVTVGSGGTGAYHVGSNGAFSSASNGGNSVFSSLTAYGGGVGGSWSTQSAGGGSGTVGSGGGGSGYTNYTGGSATVGQGNSGGNGTQSITQPHSTGGGGGAGSQGSSSSGTVSGDGGSGLSTYIRSSSVEYFGGGGGGGIHGTANSYSDGTVGSGGVGGGGDGAGPSRTNWNGAVTFTVLGESGTANTGGGGGGSGGPQTASYSYTSRGGSGGSGIVILRYTPTPSAPQNVSQSVSGSSVILNWETPVSGVVSNYRIESSTNGTTWSAVDTVTSSVRTKTISGLAALTTHYFRVVAILDGIDGTYGYPWTKIYGTITKNRDADGAITYESGFGLGANDSAATVHASNPNFSRVKFQLNTTISASSTYVETDFYKWSNNSTDTATSTTVSATIPNLRIPSTNSGSTNVIQANVEDMNIYSTNSSVTNGKGFLGRLELWPWNYATGLSGLKPAGNSATYDFDDAPSGNSYYGSFQVHNLGIADTSPVFVWNRHQNGQTAEIAYGKNSGAHPDWTFCADGGANGSCPSPSSFRLQIFVNTPVVLPDVTAPTYSS